MQSTAAAFHRENIREMGVVLYSVFGARAYRAGLAHAHPTGGLAAGISRRSPCRPPIRAAWGSPQLEFFPKKGPASSGACTGNHPAMRETGLSSWLSSMLGVGLCAASGAAACFSGWSAIRLAAGPVFGMRTMHSM